MSNSGDPDKEETWPCKILLNLYLELGHVLINLGLELSIPLREILDPKLFMYFFLNFLGFSWMLFRYTLNPVNISHCPKSSQYEYLTD